MPRAQGGLTRAATDEERRELERRAAGRRVARRDHQRAVVVLRVLAGAPVAAAARAAGCSETTAALWCRRFQAHGVAGLADRPRSGRPLTYSATQRQRVLEVGRTPPDPARDGTATWSLALLARRLRREPGLEYIDPTTVRRFFVAAGLSWQADRSWCRSPDPALEEKRGPSRPPTPR